MALARTLIPICSYLQGPLVHGYRITMSLTIERAKYGPGLYQVSIKIPTRFYLQGPIAHGYRITLSLTSEGAEHGPGLDLNTYLFLSAGSYSTWAPDYPVLY